jgi:Amt family ammonium transporter
MDLDQFKIVNDTCGHMAGDQLLKQLSILLTNTIRENDTIARLGGDEFGLLLHNCDKEAAQEFVDKVLSAVADFRFSHDDKVFSIGVSIGVVVIDADSENLANILAAADSACYLAKEEGRNRSHFYQANEEALVNRHREIQWVSRLKNALEERRIVLYGQKIAPTDNQSDLPYAVEVLMRIEDDDNLIMPGSFIGAAERYDLMPILDHVVVSYVFDWIEQRLDHPKMQEIEFFTINISGLSVGQGDFLSYVKERISQTPRLSRKICFELTETAAVSNLESAKHFMSELKKVGCRFALDDFGSGMSSFAYLKNLPVDYLKIDGHFIKDIIKDPVDRAMVMAVNQVGHVMGLKTIAEYVEDDQVHDALLEMGIDYVQGYNIGHPTPLDECCD